MGTMQNLDIHQQAPLNSFVAIANDESHIIAVASTYRELKEKLKGVESGTYFLWKTPPSWNRFAF